MQVWLKLLKLFVHCDPGLGVGEVVGGFRNVIPIVGGTFEVTGEKYSWLRNSMFIGTLDLHPKGVHLHFYQLV